MSKLSLTTRKNIKEQEPKLQAALKKITTASGITFDTEFDWVVLAPVAEERGYKDRVGDMVLDWYMDALASSITSFCTDPIQKESFVETFGSAKRITFELYEAEEGDYSYNRTRNDSGSLVMGCPPSRFGSNVSNMGSDLSQTCSGDSGLSVAARKNIKDQEPQRKKHLTKIQKTSGIDFEIDVDWMVASEAAKSRSYADRAGEVIYNWYLEALANNIETYCKDNIQKESFVEAFGEKKTIAFNIITAPLDDESPYRYTYNWIVNKDGALEINIPTEKFASNVSNTGDNLSQACSGDSAMSVATRKNIKDQEPQRKKHLTKIQKATGIEFDIDIDWVVASEAAKSRSYADRAGEVIYNWYLEALANNIETYCKDGIQKESFVEAFGEKKTIAFNIIKDPLDDDSPYRYTYNWIVNKDGALEINIPTEKFASNVSNTGDNLSKACSGDSAMSVATRKNIKDQEATFKKHMTRINKATGIEYELEIDWVPFAAAAKSRGYEDRVGEVIYNWYLEALANNLEKLCKDDMAKEAVAEACERKTIAFKLVDQEELGYEYSKCTFDDGVLTISLSTDRFASNVSNCGNDIESRL